MQKNWGQRPGSSKVKLEWRGRTQLIFWPCSLMLSVNWASTQMFGRVGAFSALTLLIGRQEEHSACKNWVTMCWCGCLSGVMQIVCIWSSWCRCTPKPHHILPHYIHTGFIFLVLAYPVCPEKDAIKWLYSSSLFGVVVHVGPILVRLIDQHHKSTLMSQKKIVFLREWKWNYVV